MSSDKVSFQTKNSMRELLVAISERTPNASERTQLLHISLQDVIAKWESKLNESTSITLADIFSSSQCLLQTCIDDFTQEGSRRAIVEMKAMLQAILVTTKRVQIAPLPDEIWTAGHFITTEQLTVLAPFTGVWVVILPIVLKVLKVLNGIWEPSFRVPFTESSPGAMTLYMPLAASKSNPAFLDVVSPVLSNIRKNFDELRQIIFQVLSQASMQKVIYTLPDWHNHLLLELSNSCTNLENSHTCSLCKSFLETYILNCFPCHYDVVAVFLSNFIENSIRRIMMAYSSSQPLIDEHNSKEIFYAHIYR